MSEAPNNTRRVPWLRLLLALLGLHFFVALRAWRWDDSADTWWMVTPDLWIVLTACCLLCQRFGYRFWIGHLGVFGILWVPVFRVPEHLFPTMYGQPFSLVDDLGQATGLFNALVVDRPDHHARLYAWLGLVALVLLWSVLYLAVRTLGRQLTERAPAGILLAVAASMLILAATERSLAPERPSRLFNQSMFGATLRQLQQFGKAASLAPRVTAAQHRLEQTPQDLTRLGQADLLLFFVESYGRSAFGHATYGAMLRRNLSAIQTELDKHGDAAASMWLTSPVSGSQSQVSHATILSGIPLASYRDWHALHASAPPRMLPHILADRGYTRVNINPKLEIDWPASRAFYGFDVDLFGKDTTYTRDGGARYHWPNAPDQYFLALARQRFLVAGKPPAFLMFIGGISHAPYSRIPPVLSDWTRATDAKAYTPIKDTGATFLDYHTRPGIEAAYLETLQTTLQVLQRFVAAAERPLLVLAIGDHQAPKTGAIAPDPTDFAVPLHALTNTPALLEPLRALGTVQGMMPDGAAERPMARFLAAFLRAYSK